MKKVKAEQYDKKHYEELDADIMHYKKLVRGYEEVITINLLIEIKFKEIISKSTN